MPRDLTVVKAGGHEVDDADWLAGLGRSVGRVAPAVVVHGGGKEISALQTRLGQVPEWRDGVRVTDGDTLGVVSMVLSGLVNKRVVSALIGVGVRAVGVSGEDDALFGAELVLDGALGHYGVVTAVRPDVIDLLLRAGVTPVVSPLSRGADGRPVNVNADDAAAALAVALGARRLVFVSNVPGVDLEGKVASEVTAERVEAAVAAGVVTGGMAPKLRAALRASGGGIPDVRIGDLGIVAGVGGTRVVAPSERAA